MRVMFNLAIFRHSHSSVGRLIETLPGACGLGPAKGLSSDVVVPESISGM